MSSEADLGDGRQIPVKRVAESSSTTTGIESDGTHQAKRSRVTRACDQCRASREKCDGAKPICVTCVALKRSCSYKEPPKKRGIQPNYIRTLELTLTWVLQTFPEAEKQLAQSLPNERGSTSVLISGKDSTASEAVLTLWRNSLVCKQIDQLLSAVPIEHEGQLLTAVPPAEVGTDAVPHSSQSSPPRMGDYRAAAFGNNDSELYAQSGKPPEGCEVTFEGANKSLTSSALVVLPHNAWLLLDYHFAFVHSWLPMTEKHDMLKLMYCYPETGLPYSEMRAAGHAELWAILSLASAQVAGNDDPRDEVDRLRSVAEKLIPTGKTAYESPHIKAMLLLGTLDMHDENLLAAWLRVGSVVRLLLLFKILHNAGAREKWCRHIHFVAFILESALATRLRAPSHLRSGYIDPMGYVEEDGSEEWTPWKDPLVSRSDSQSRIPARAFSTLNHLVRMSRRAVDDQDVAGSLKDSTPKSPVWSLLTNASSKMSRMQPYDLVRAYIEGGEDDAHVQQTIGLHGSGSIEPHDTGNAQAAGTISPIEYSGAAGYSSHLLHISPQPSHNHRDNEASVFPLNQLNTATKWPNDVNHQPVNLASTVQGTSNAYANIFEEYDNLLEAEDTNHYPQFMQNLGFAPDSDLAEFFGADYQPSNPLLAYIDPARYGLVQP